MFRILNLETGTYLQWPEYNTTEQLLDRTYPLRRGTSEPLKVPTEFCSEEVAEAYLERYRSDHAYSAPYVFEGDSNIYYRIVKPSWESFKIIDATLEDAGEPLNRTLIEDISSF